MKATTLVALSVDESIALPSGVSESRLRTLVELRLRSAGIRVLTDEEDSRDAQSNPYVMLSVMLLQTTSKAGMPLGYVFATHASVRISSRVAFNETVAPQELWSHRYLDVADTDRASEALERTVARLMDGLVNEWLAANPRR